MKIGIVAPAPAPYVFGGAERLWRGLAGWINAKTEHTADIVMLPSPESTLHEVVESYRQMSALDVGAFDVVVSTKYPAWMIEHPRHVVYLQHTLRGLYDTYRLTGLPSWLEEPGPPQVEALLEAARMPPERRNLSEIFSRFHQARVALGDDHPMLSLPGPVAREVVQGLDAIGLDVRRVRGHLAISRTVAMRSSYYPPATRVEVVHHPSDLTGFRCARPEYLFTASRIDGPKRVELLVAAMKHVPFGVSLKIAGTGPDLDRVRELAKGDDRIEFLGHISDNELIDHYSRAIAVPFVPLDEDLGLITLEAMLSGKPVVTTTDSGGPTELVVDHVHGLVAAPTPAAVGAALCRVVAGPALAAAMGSRAVERGERVTWDRVFGTIMRAADASRPRRRSARPRLVVTSTFPVHPPIGGGQLRAHHLYGNISRSLDVQIMSLTAIDHPFGHVVVGDGFTETIVRKSPTHHAREVAIERNVHLPITDIVASALTRDTAGYIDGLRRALDGASAVLLAHPYLFPIVNELGEGLPICYDAVDAEFALKDRALPDNESGDALRDIVRAVEGAAVRASRVVTVCSKDDAERLRNVYADRPYVCIANGVDTGSTPFIVGYERLRRSDLFRRRLTRLDRDLSRCHHLALFVGSFHPPNLEAVNEIASFAQQMPDVAFLVAGSVCHRFWREELPRNVVLLGVVSDALKRRLLGAADVALNPMRTGTGTNLKIIEYFASGVPTVSTALGARGLEADWHRDVVVSDLGDFPTAMRRMLDDVLGGAAMATRARRVAEREYDWKVLAARMLSALQESIPELAEAEMSATG